MMTILGILICLLDCVKTNKIINGVFKVGNELDRM